MEKTMARSTCDSTPAVAARRARRYAPALAAAFGASLLLVAPNLAFGDEEPPQRGDGARISDERVSPLAGQPPVRNRRLLVNQRLEITPSFESTLNADYRHTLSGGIKAEYHMLDTWSLGVLGLFGESFNTGLTNRIIASLPDTPGDTPDPSKAQFEQHLNSIPIHGAAYASFKPFYGKLAAFGSIFLSYSFYVQGGLAVAVLDNDCCDFPTNAGDGDPRTDPPTNDGTQLGIYAATGMQVFFSDFLALDLSVRDYYFRDNPSGLDYTGDLRVTDDDNRLMHHFAVGAGLSLFFPRKARRTD
jgi:outer membrane beta-barrel protein